MAKKRRRDIAVGEVWFAEHDDMPGQYWRYQIVDVIEDRGRRYIIGAKRQPSGELWILVFDDDFKDNITDFYLSRKSQAKPFVDPQALTFAPTITPIKGQFERKAPE
jgi:hypothetical protein